ncbi:MAG: hypothetical protein CFE22_03810 [Cytophagaceae bacterium BCCC1]|nr:MAG: hypothetical protein CFE22_03810 [Cytophagaceae bacterium BCCC1]
MTKFPDTLKTFFDPLKTFSDPPKTFSDPLTKFSAPPLTLYALDRMFENTLILLYDHFRNLFDTLTAFYTPIIFSIVEIYWPKALLLVCSVMILAHNFEHIMPTWPDVLKVFKF